MFEIKEDFYWKGSPIKIISGALHYFRVVPEYWEDRLMKLKAMGCNTVETYVPWNLHEPQEGTFDFEGILDIRAFVELAQKLDLFVIVRPSPYICAEWEFGGLPAWLLKYDGMKFRCNHSQFLEKVESYYQKLLKEIVSLQVTHVGPIIMMQVENEYGSYGNDKAYMYALTEIMEENGVDVPLVTSDGPWLDMFDNGTILDKALPTVNCGSDSKKNTEVLSKFVGKDIPLMVMEFWIGWFTAWGDKELHHTKVETAAKELDDLLDIGHVNFYMFHGGTNFGFTNGANYYDYLTPDVTSYDYDAPLTEWGDITEKYKAFREIIEKHVDYELPALPKPSLKRKYEEIEVQEKTSLFENLENLTQPIFNEYPLSMEKLDQNFGYILYRGDIGKKRHIEDFRLIGTNDRAQVFINEELVLTQYDKELGEKVELDLVEENNTMDILVENMGRVNYGVHLPHQHKGINEGVVVNGAFRSDWEHYSLPLENLESLDFTKEYQDGKPAFYRFELQCDECKDTFVDMTGWGKGVVFVNGFNLGRFWEKGPQYKLYLPAPVLKEGSNEIVVFETEGVAKSTLTFSDQPPY